MKKTNVATAVVLLSAIGVLTGLCHLWSLRQPAEAIYARKVLHIASISACALSVYVVADRRLLLAVVLLCLPLLYWLVYRGAFFDPARGRRSWGIVYFAVVFAGLLYFFPDPRLVCYPMLILALADGTATLAGSLPRLIPGNFGLEGRSIQGSVAFMAMAVLAWWLPSHVANGIAPALPNAWAIGIGAAWLVLIEALCTRGRDNLWVPAAALYWMLLYPDYLGVAHLLQLAVLALAAALTVRLRWLSASGVLGALALGIPLLFSPLPRALLAPLLFFLCGSVLSKVTGNDTDARGRSVAQVFSNGLIPTACFLIYFVRGHSPALVAALAGFGAALSDTAASEIGRRYGRKAFRMVSLRAARPGVSGAISLTGSLAGVLGALLMGATAWLYPVKAEVIAGSIIAGAALAGNVIDSLAGDALQAKYLDASGVWKDWTPEVKTNPEAGWKGINNDAVNMIATAGASVIAWVAATTIGL